MTLRIFLFGLFFNYTAIAQNNVGIGTSTPAPSSVLDLTSTNQGFLPPRMTWAQIQAIPNPVAGLTVYDIGNKVLRVYDGMKWTIAGNNASQIFDAPGAFSSVNKSGNITVACIKILPDKSLLIGGNAVPGNSIGGHVASGTGAYFAKLDSNGTGVFFKQLVGSSFIRAIDSDQSGKIYISGIYYSTVNFNPAGSNSLTAAANYSDAFVASYSDLGIYNWAVSMGGEDAEESFCLTTDGSSVYAGGTFYSNTFSAGCGSLTNATPGGYADGWLAEFDASTGVCQWVQRCGGVGTAVRALSIYSGGGLAVAGYYSGSGTISFLPLSVTGYGSGDGFFGLINTASGGFLSAYRIGGTGQDYILDMVTDEAGKIYIAGNFSGTANLSLTGGSYTAISTGSSDGMVVAYNASFTVSAVATVRANSGHTVVNALRIDQGGNVYATGSGVSSVVAPSIDIGAMKVAILGGYDAFITKFNNSLGVQWLHQGGSIGLDGGSKLDVSTDGRLLYSTISLPANNTTYFTYGHQRLNSGNSTFSLERYEQ